jgi:hypothetical protein
MRRPEDGSYRLVLLRHRQSGWNARNLFTGWVNVPLTEAGEQEAVQAGRLLAAHRLLRAGPNTLTGTPFSDWRLPGVLLAGLVGGGLLLAGWWQWRDYRYARQPSMIAGAGLIGFEAAELAWIGFRPLEAVFAAVGVIIIGLAWHAKDSAMTCRRRSVLPVLRRSAAAPALGSPVGRAVCG